MQIDVGGRNDPIAKFGKQASDYIMVSIKGLPPEMRKPALKAVFDQIDRKLWSRVAAKANVLHKRHGFPAKVAMEKAIAASMSIGLLEEFVRAGKTGRVEPKSMLGLACYGDQAERYVLTGFEEALGLSWGDLNPLKWVAKGTGKVTGTMAPYGAKVGEWGKGVINAVGAMACNVAGSRMGQIAAGAGAAAAGAPPEVGAKGANLVSGMCTPAGPVYQPPPAAGIPWLPIILISGGVVALILILK
jgi:hypothetical protein